MRQLFLYLVIVVILAVAGDYLFYLKQLPRNLGLHGNIIISATQDPRDDMLETGFLNLDTESVQAIRENETSHGAIYSFSSNKKHVTFLGLTLSSLQMGSIAKIQPGQAVQVYSADATGAAALPSPDSARLLTNSSDLIKQTPEISDDGSAVLYVSTNSQNIPGTGDPGISGYSLHLVKISATTTTDSVLTIGIQPRWITNTIFCYIATDGIRLWDTVHSQSLLVLPVTGQSDFKLSVSPNHKILAFSFPDANKVLIYDLASDGTFSGHPGSIPIMGFWVVFSPDSKFMAIQTAQPGSGHVLSHPSIEFYDAATLQKVDTEISLDPFLNDRLFVTAWL